MQYIICKCCLILIPSDETHDAFIGLGEPYDKKKIIIIHFMRRSRGGVEGSGPPPPL